MWVETMDEMQDEAEIIRIGEEAVRAVRQTFERWLEVARALEIGRHWAMSEAGTNQPAGRGYNEAFRTWLKRHPIFDEIKESTRTWLYKCYQHRHDILKWREQRGVGEIARYNYPETVFKRWERATDPEVAIAKKEADDKPQKPSPTQLQRELGAAQAHIAELEGTIVRLNDERARLINLDWDTIDKIAAALRASMRWNDIRRTLIASEKSAQHANLHVTQKRAPVGVNGVVATPGGGRKSKYPFADLEVGQSFVVEGQPQKSVGARCTTAGQRLGGRRFSTKRVDSQNVEVTRVA